MTAKASRLESLLTETARAGDPECAADLFEKAGRCFLEDGDIRGMMAVGDHLERFGRYLSAWTFLAEAGCQKSKDPIAEWRGEDLSGKSLLVRQRIRHLGSVLRMSCFVHAAIDAGAKVTIEAEARVVPLFRRSFPRARVVESNSLLSPDTFDYAASYERLAQQFGCDRDMISKRFRPLVPDPSLTARLRARYGGNGRNVVGIAWSSNNSRKDLPALADWAGAVSRVPGKMVSLQYNPDAAKLGELCDLLGAEIMNDTEVDQMSDVDGFAAQVAATDFILTISNTTAHMAGALGKRCIVVLDDKAHLTWPTGRNRTPLAPSLTLVRRRGRPWGTVMDEVVGLAGDFG